MHGHWWAVVTAWGATAVAAIATASLASTPRTAELLTLVLAIALVVAFALQLIVADRVGFVARLTVSACGSLAIVVVVALISLLR